MRPVRTLMLCAAILAISRTAHADCPRPAPNATQDDYTKWLACVAQDSAGGAQTKAAAATPSLGPIKKKHCEDPSRFVQCIGCEDLTNTCFAKVIISRIQDFSDKALPSPMGETMACVLNNIDSGPLKAGDLLKQVLDKDARVEALTAVTDRLNAAFQYLDPRDALASTVTVIEPTGDRWFPVVTINSEKLLDNYLDALEGARQAIPGASCLVMSSTAKDMIRNKLKEPLSKITKAAQVKAQEAIQKAISKGLVKMVNKIAGKLDTLAKNKGAIAAAWRDLAQSSQLQPSRLNDLAAAVDDMTNALSKKDQVAFAAARKKYQDLLKAQPAAVTPKMLLETVGPAVVAAPVLAIEHLLVEEAVREGYDDVLLVIKDVAVQATDWAAEEVCAAGDVFTEWACGAVNKVIFAVIDILQTKLRGAITQKIAQAIEKAIDPKVSALVESAIKKVAEPAIEVAGKEFDDAVTKLGGINGDGARAADALRDVGKKVASTVSDLIKSMLQDSLSPTDLQLKTAIEGYNKSLEKLAGALPSP